MNHLKTLVIATAITFISGCSSTPVKRTIEGSVQPREYNSEQSLAYNLAVQTGQIEGIYDFDIPEEYRDLHATPDALKKGANIALTATHFLIDPIGASVFYTGLILPSHILFSTEKGKERTGNHPTFFGWRPNDGKTPAEAADHVRKEAAIATEKMLNESPYTILERGVAQRIMDLGLTDSNFDGFVFYDKKAWELGGESAANSGAAEIFIHIKTPEGKALSVKAPDYSAVPSDDAMLFSSSYHDSSTDRNYVEVGNGDFNFNYIQLNMRRGKMNTYELLVNLSKYLPDWMYLYIPPNYAQVEDGKPVSMPLLLNQGNVMLFAKPQQPK